MPAARFVEALNAQIGNELAAHNQYLACAVHYDAETMPQMAAFFYGQALEERDHAMMMVQFLLDTDCAVKIPGVEAPKTDFASIIDPVELALAQEKRVSEQVVHGDVFLAFGDEISRAPTFPAREQQRAQAQGHRVDGIPHGVASAGDERALLGESKRRA